MMNVRQQDRIKSRKLREKMELPRAEHYILTPIVRYIEKILHMRPEAIQRKVFYAEIKGKRCLQHMGDALARCEEQIIKYEDGSTVSWEKKKAIALELDTRDTDGETAVSIEDGYEKAMLYGPISMALKKAFITKKGREYLEKENTEQVERHGKEGYGGNMPEIKRTKL